MKRINVVGTSASGKSTFSSQLAEKLNLEYIELDDLFWMNDWQETPDADFIQKIENAILKAESNPNQQGYIIDGNYTRTIAIKWKDIDTVIWLDLPFSLNLFRSIKRALSRAIFKTKLWKSSNNTENFRQMLGRDSIILWMIKTHQKNRNEYLQMMNNSDYAHIDFIKLSSQKEIEHFLSQFSRLNKTLS